MSSCCAEKSGLNGENMSGKSSSSLAASLGVATGGVSNEMIARGGRMAPKSGQLLIGVSGIWGLGVEVGMVVISLSCCDGQISMALEGETKEPVEDVLCLGLCLGGRPLFFAGI